MTEERFVGEGEARGMNHEEGVPVSRVEAFERMAAARAAGETVFLPCYQSGNDRRLHVRQTLREDHQTRIHRRPQGATHKFDKLAGSLFAFFRGTALLFYRDMAGEDAWSPTVLALGDVHPENFGVMPSADNTPFFGVNDFDEAYYAPFTWDVKRGATGFMVAAHEQGLSKAKQEKIAECFVRGYVEGLAEYARSDREDVHQLRLDNSPPLIKALLEDSLVERSRFLAKYLDEKRGGFRSSDELVPRTSRREEFQRVIDGYREHAKPRDCGRAGEFKVKDVAEKLGSGTASLGLERYYVLLEGPSRDGTDDVILELKQARRSALAGLAPPSQHKAYGTADRVVNAHAVHLVGGDPFYGKAEVDGTEYLVRERSPYKNEIDLDELNKKEWKRYADWCGRVLAQAHARSEAGTEPDGPEVEKRILLAIVDSDLFVHDVLEFTREAFVRLVADHAAFERENALGAFRFADAQWK